MNIQWPHISVSVCMGHVFFAKAATCKNETDRIKGPWAHWR